MAAAAAFRSLATMPPVKPLVARPPLSFVEAKRQEVRTASKPAENATCKFATSAVSGICCVWYSALDLLCGPCGRSPGAPPGSTSIFNAGENGYFTFRIPALLALPNGNLVCYAEGRRDGSNDAGAIDIVYKRASPHCGIRLAIHLFRNRGGF